MEKGGVRLVFWLAVGLWLGCLSPAALAAAGEDQPTVRATGGEFNNIVDLVLDGRMAREGSDWNSADCVWWEQSHEAALVIDLRSVRLVRDVRIQVDNNDDYEIAWSADGKLFRKLFQLGAGTGTVSLGMETFSTVKGEPEYEATIDFRPVKARYLRIRSVSGDGMYSVSEIDVVADPAP